MTVPIRVESGLLAEWRQPSPETAVYRIYDAADNLLYVGITNDLVIRWIGHRSDKLWWRTEAHRYDVRWYPNREVAKAHEKQAIITEGPRYNEVFSVPPRPVKQSEPGVYMAKEIRHRFRISQVTLHALAARPDFPRAVNGLPLTDRRGARFSADEIEEFFRVNPR
ncbi:GIY-YIG nuclease family protein [Streptomyces sp. NPDC051997]|uniref:GIY-YIG nuclease family protein n=1 Tax=Streptomyces sp. NPDC051997 TaxID=3155611 RepID=UPI003413E7B9